MPHHPAASDTRPLLDQLESGVRGWSESHTDDPAVALIELWASVADTIAFYADRVAEESYLAPARGPAEVTVEIDGEPWERVPSFADSRPDDRHYVVERRGPASTVVRFGDGKKGRRPRDGASVRAEYHLRTAVLAVELQQGQMALEAGRPAVPPRRSRA